MAEANLVDLGGVNDETVSCVCISSRGVRNAHECHSQHIYYIISRGAGELGIVLLLCPSSFRAQTLLHTAITKTCQGCLSVILHRSSLINMMSIVEIPADNHAYNS